MKSLGRTIDRILRIDPDLQEKLLPIKSKWERYPKREMSYWKQLIDVLNTGELLKHPDREKIRNAVITKRQLTKKYHTFLELPKNEKVIGVIPENIADRIRRYDRASVQLAKRNVEARMTNNYEMIPHLIRDNERIELQTRKCWYELKDHFNLWQWEPSRNFYIRKYQGTLVITIPQSENPGNSSGNDPLVTIMKIDPSLIKQFFKNLGIELPPGLFPDNDE